MKSMFYYDTEIGSIGIADNGEAITNIFFEGEDDPVDAMQTTRQETPLIREAAKQIKEYLKGERKAFDLPLGAEGTAFQKAAWEALLTIPYGETRSYKQMAEQVGNPKACRAIGLANNRNPISIIVPCHRVMAQMGN